MDKPTDIIFRMFHDPESVHIFFKLRYMLSKLKRDWHAQEIRRKKILRKKGVLK